MVTLQRVVLAPVFRDTRNPFRGKGLAVTLALLLEPTKHWSLAELAETAEVSRPLVTKVVRSLRDLDLVDGEVVQGRAATLRPRPELFFETARRWPAAGFGVLGGHVPDDLPTGGGPVIAAALGVPWQAPARVYVRTPDDVARVLARSGGGLVSEALAEWQLAVVNFPLARGPVPPLVAALELGPTPRGWEMLQAHAHKVLVGFPEAA